MFEGELTTKALTQPADVWCFGMVMLEACVFFSYARPYRIWQICYPVLDSNGRTSILSYERVSGGEGCLMQKWKA